MGEHLRGKELAGARVAVQHHGSGADGLDELLSAHGADVVSLTVYRWGPSRRPEQLRRSVELAGTGGADGVLFTSAPGATGWLEAAEQAGQLDRIRARALAGELLLACVGPITARGARAAGAAGREDADGLADPHRGPALRDRRGVTGGTPEGDTG